MKSTFRLQKLHLSLHPIGQTETSFGENPPGGFLSLDLKSTPRGNLNVCSFLL
jgi:hypothetical protein